MNKLLKYVAFLLLISCTSGNINSENDKNFSQYLPECTAGCLHLASLKDEFDDELGCTQGRSAGEECKILCAKKMASGNKNVSPKCWITLKSCNDFEEQCNFGELYP